MKTFFFFLLLSLGAFEAFSSDPLLIKKDFRGFYAELSLSPNSAREDVKSKVLLSLNSPKTLFAKDCGAFASFDCSQFGCSKREQTETTEVLPFITFKGSQVDTQGILATNKYQISSPVYLAYNCQTYTEYGLLRMGILGMANTNNYRFMINDGMFSISMYKNMTGGEIFFGTEGNLTTNPISLSTNENWMFPAYAYGMTYPNGITESYQSRFDLMFDLDTEGIGLPAYLFKHVIQLLRISCDTRSALNPVCECNCHLSDLPSIAFGTDYAIRIPPQAYVLNPTDSFHKTIQLNIKVLSPRYEGENKINAEYDDVVVLGAQFLSYYSVLFSEKNVKIYPPVQPKEEIKEDNVKMIIYGILILSFIIILVVVILYLRSKESKTSLRNNLLSQSHSENRF